MKYQVPQFIEIEDKVIGPFTVKQFIYLAGGAGLCFIAYTFLYFYLALILIVPIAALSLALAFYKVNGKPFINVLEAAFLYYTKQNLYIWKKTEKSSKQQGASSKEKQNTQVVVPRMSDSKLKDLSWSLDINQNANPLTSQSGETTK